MSKANFKDGSQSPIRGHSLRGKKPCRPDRFFLPQPREIGPHLIFFWLGSPLRRIEIATSRIWERSCKWHPTCDSASSHRPALGLCLREMWGCLSFRALCLVLRHPYFEPNHVWRVDPLNMVCLLGFHLETPYNHVAAFQAMLSITNMAPQTAFGVQTYESKASPARRQHPGFAI